MSAKRSTSFDPFNHSATRSSAHVLLPQERLDVLVLARIDFQIQLLLLRALGPDGRLLNLLFLRFAASHRTNDRTSH
jgi:hypothetical protein